MAPSPGPSGTAGAGAWHSPAAPPAPQLPRGAPTGPRSGGPEWARQGGRQVLGVDTCHQVATRGSAAEGQASGTWRALPAGSAHHHPGQDEVPLEPDLWRVCPSGERPFPLSAAGLRQTLPLPLCCFLPPAPLPGITPVRAPCARGGGPGRWGPCPAQGSRAPWLPGCRHPAGSCLLGLPTASCLQRELLLGRQGGSGQPCGRTGLGP